MIPRLSSALAVLVLAACLAGCAPDASPAPSPTGFASEEEAFAAAEETYRAYVDALNRVDLSDPATFEDVYAWTTGELNASDRKGLSTYYADAVTVSGNSNVALVAQGEPSVTVSGPTLAVCLDVSEVEVVDASGNSLVDRDRVDIQSLSVTLVSDRAPQTGFLISGIQSRSGDPQCV